MQQQHNEQRDLSDLVNSHPRIHSTANNERRILDAQTRFETIETQTLVDEPLSIWVLPSDRHLPMAMLHLILREIVSVTYAELSNIRGVGATKVEKLLNLIERALDPLQSSNASRADNTSVGTINPNVGLNAVSSTNERSVSTTIQRTLRKKNNAVRTCRYGCPNFEWANSEYASSFANRFKAAVAIT